MQKQVEQLHLNEKAEAPYPLNGVAQRVQELRQMVVGAYGEIEALKTRLDKLTEQHVYELADLNAQMGRLTERMLRVEKSFGSNGLLLERE